jgi:hypothetical protein
MATTIRIVDERVGIDVAVFDAKTIVDWSDESVRKPKMTISMTARTTVAIPSPSDRPRLMERRFSRVTTSGEAPFDASGACSSTAVNLPTLRS